MASKQEFNEALLKLCILLYQVDGKITLSEQDYFQALYDKVDWQGEVDLTDFLIRSIYHVREVIESQEQKDVLNSLKDGLNFDAKKAMAVAKGLAHIDGNVAEEEEEILNYLQNRVLAKSLHAA